MVRLLRAVLGRGQRRRKPSDSTLGTKRQNVFQPRPPFMDLSVSLTSVKDRKRPRSNFKIQVDAQLAPIFVRISISKIQPRVCRPELRHCVAHWTLWCRHREPLFLQHLQVELVLCDDSCRFQPDICVFWRFLTHFQRMATGGRGLNSCSLQVCKQSPASKCQHARCLIGSP